MKCSICKNKDIKLLKYFGSFPRSYDLKKEYYEKYKFELNQCNNCSVIQLKKMEVIYLIYLN